MIDIQGLTLKYPSGKGVFNLNFSIQSGEAVGYLGPNGAGKTTTIRALMGFMKPDSGHCTIERLDCFAHAPKIQQTLGYIPGEIAFLEGMNGDEYLKFIGDMRGTKNRTRQKELLDRFELLPKGSIKKYSKGMKQKLGIVAAFMHDPQVLVLDEPTSGLDPLMQNRFVELILEEKAKGKTILMSSHIFEEIERACERVLIIKEGHILTQSDIQTLKASRRKSFLLSSNDTAATAALFSNEGFLLGQIDGNTVEVFVTGGDVDRFGKLLGQVTLTGLDVRSQSLEDVFLHYYEGGNSK